MNNYLKRKLLTTGLFVLSAIIIECFLFIYLDFGFLPKYFMFDITAILFFASVIFFIKTGWVQNIFLCLLLLIQIIVAYINICMYKTLNDIFTFDMVNLIDETVDVVKFNMLPIWPLIFYLSLFCLNCVCLALLNKLKSNSIERRSTMKFLIRNFCVLALSTFFIAYSLCGISLKVENDDDYYLFSDYVLYNTFSSSRQSLIKFGSYGFYLEEFFRRFYDYDIPVSYTRAELETFVNSSEYDPKQLSLYNVAEDSNVVVLMCESLEWYGISSELTPTLYALANGYDFGNEYQNFNFYNFTKNENGFTSLTRKDYDYDTTSKKYTKNSTNTIFDDLNDFGTYGLTMTNYFSKAKTDYSEMSVMLGNYPYNESYTSHGGLLGYGSSELYSDLNYGFSLPNMLLNTEKVDVANYMHSYYSTFYGRDKLIPQFGFENIRFLEQINDDKIEVGNSLSHIIKDSQVMDYYLNISADKFMPKNEKFLSYYTTVTMHGEYSYNPLLEKNYEFVDSLNYIGKNDAGVNNAGLSLDIGEQIRTYYASVLDLEYTATLIVKYLIDKNLFDNTVLVLYADHQSYYGNLDLEYKKLFFSNEIGEFSSPIEWERGGEYVDEYGMRNPDRYKVPAIIYSEKITDSIVGTESDSHYVDKMTCSFDITPTLFTLLGVEYKPSLYMGYPVICNTYNKSLGRTVDLGVNAIISHTGNIFNQYITTADGVTVFYTKNGVTEEMIEDFSYEVAKQLDKWYKITELYEKNMLVKS